MKNEKLTDEDRYNAICNMLSEFSKIYKDYVEKNLELFEEYSISYILTGFSTVFSASIYATCLRRLNDKNKQQLLIDEILLNIENMIKQMLLTTEEIDYSIS